MKRIELNELQGVKMKYPELKFLLGGYSGGYEGGGGCFSDDGIICGQHSGCCWRKAPGGGCMFSGSAIDYCS